MKSFQEPDRPGNVSTMIALCGRIGTLETTWAGLSLLVALVSSALFERINILALLPIFACLLAAVGLVLIRVGAIAFERSRGANLRRLGWTSVTVVIVAALSIPVSRFGDWANHRIHFALDRSRLERIVQIESTRPGGPRSDDTQRYSVDIGPPLRIAFVWSGLLDNWCGPVYDPSGFVMRVNAFRGDWSNWDDPALATVKKLFGGDMRSCEQLEGPFYFCCFT